MSANFRWRRYSAVIFLIPVVLIMISCSTPQVVTKLTPEAPEGYYEHGREYITLTSDSIYAVLGFDGFYDNTLIFDLIVINHGDKSLTIDPATFYYEILDSALALNSSLPPVLSLPPDTISKRYDQTIESLFEGKQANKFFGILEATAGIVMNTSGFIATDDPGYILDLITGTVNTAGYYLTRDTEFKKNISIMTDEKAMVREASHDQKELAPGETVSGFVFFPQNMDARYYMFCFPLDDELFQFVYRQEVTIR